MYFHIEIIQIDLQYKLKEIINFHWSRLLGPPCREMPWLCRMCFTYHGSPHHCGGPGVLGLQKKIQHKNDPRTLNHLLVSWFHGLMVHPKLYNWVLWDSLKWPKTNIFWGHTTNLPGFHILEADRSIWDQCTGRSAHPLATASGISNYPFYSSLRKTVVYSKDKYTIYTYISIRCSMCLLCINKILLHCGWETTNDTLLRDGRNQKAHLLLFFSWKIWEVENDAPHSQKGAHLGFWTKVILSIRIDSQIWPADYASFRNLMLWVCFLELGAKCQKTAWIGLNRLGTDYIQRAESKVNLF